MSEIKTNKISPRRGTTTTIGDSGDSITISSGTTTTNQGTISTAGITGGTINNTTGSITGLQQQIDWQTGDIKTTAFTASANEGYFCNTTSAAFTVTLPASPTAGDVIAFKDYADTFDTNNLTIDPNGNKIQGSTNNFLITVEGTAAVFLYIDSTQGWKLIDQSKASDIAEGPKFTVATGGTITTSGDYKIHTFTAPGTFTVTQIGNAPTVPTGGPTDADYLVIAGGGGGGQTPSGPRQGGGGGGAGGLRVAATSYTLPVPAGAGNPGSTPAPNGACVSALPISVTSYPITVGGGGATGAPASAGSTSTFSTITAAGGGRGASSPTTGGSGGSGGGGTDNGGAGTGNSPPVSPAQGRNGGGTNPSTQPGGGGGGGADLDAAVSSGPGLARSAANGSCSGNQFAYGGRGGKGLVVNITGSCVSYAGGGGGGGSPYPGFPCETSGGGGSAAKAQSAYGAGYGSSGPGVSATSGTANTGGGGGGGGTVAPSGGAGGSGVVIIRYKYQ